MSDEATALALKLAPRDTGQRIGAPQDWRAPPSSAATPRAPPRINAAESAKGGNRARSAWHLHSSRGGGLAEKFFLVRQSGLINFAGLYSQTCIYQPGSFSREYGFNCRFCLLCGGLSFPAPRRVARNGSADARYLPMDIIPVFRPRSATSSQTALGILVRWPAVPGRDLGARWRDDAHDFLQQHRVEGIGQRSLA